jgi:hypothetical protein
MVGFFEYGLASGNSGTAWSVWGKNPCFFLFAVYFSRRSAERLSGLGKSGRQVVQVGAEAWLGATKVDRNSSRKNPKSTKTQSLEGN